MTTAKDLQTEQEQRALEQAVKKIRNVLLNEQFGLRIDQLSGLVRLHISKVKAAIKSMDDVELQDDHYVLKRPEIVAIAPPISEPVSEPISEQNTHINKIVERVFVAIKSQEMGISKSMLSESLGLTTKQVGNAIIRLRQSYRIEFLNNKYVYFEGEPMAASERARKRDAYYDVAQLHKCKITETVTVTRRATLTKQEIEDVLKNLLGLSEIEWTQDGVVLTKVEQVA